ncbi:hypothetical protein BYT27DRAFT_7199270 [Phlegmacium glaucopus]|nr:hypothetical protein BYT27DRAFT_7199270 [Phlegmacium glaucopus]
MDAIHEADASQELKVTFYPELFLQRRIWILNILRKENITKVLDVGCGEGQLLTVLSQPAPWLTPPPISVLAPFETKSSPNESIPPTPTYNDDEIPNLHISELHGLDISPEDLAFAVESAAPPKTEQEHLGSGYRSYNVGIQRWEELVVKVWKGGLEVINEEFMDIQCIISTEVIEHLPNNIYPAFSAMLLGVYHPETFLVTTPSYTFNARFTSPDAPKSARHGYPDPTGRTDRIFRHSDHKFEWTREEFTMWCEETAKEWGYEVQQTSIGRALEQDLWERDEELQGATSVAVFRRLGDMDNRERERKGRALIQSLGLDGAPHEALAIHKHLPHGTAMNPSSLEDIAKKVRSKMEGYREGFMRVEELWFEQEIAMMCGGWIEMLVRAVEECSDLVLRNEVEGVKRGRNMWTVELIGGVNDLANLEVAAGNDADEESDEETTGWASAGWGKADSGWTIPHSARSSTAGWDGDEDDSDNTTS